MKNFKQSFVPAIAHVFSSLLYIIFIFPFDIWKRAAINLAEQKANGSLRISKINSAWPFLSFLKTLLLEFIFDMLSFLSYFIGIGVAIYTLIDSGEFAEFLAVLGVAYYAPVSLIIVRDVLQLLVMPYKKFISWCSKPSQYLDLNVKNSSVKQQTAATEE